MRTAKDEGDVGVLLPSTVHSFVTEENFHQHTNRGLTSSYGFGSVPLRKRLSVAYLESAVARLQAFLASAFQRLDRLKEIINVQCIRHLKKAENISENSVN